MGVPLPPTYFRQNCTLHYQKEFGTESDFLVPQCHTNTEFRQSFILFGAPECPGHNDEYHAPMTERWMLVGHHRGHADRILEKRKRRHFDDFLGLTFDKWSR